MNSDHLRALTLRRAQLEADDPSLLTRSRGEHAAVDAEIRAWKAEGGTLSGLPCVFEGEGRLGGGLAATNETEA